ncbi:MAG: prepilin-type N-terminal cleavage/methylation domain-containing protein [Pseudomonadota bacterium]|nr:prepilin-type N-terminal cleavage/methylation domain-containing protein [Pseudomonadota bacterium]
MNRRMNMRVSQDGFTIVELMIALGIALIIVLGLYAFLVDTQRSYLNVASNDQNNRRSKNAVTVTRNFLQQAGFVNYLNARASIGLGNAADPARCNGKSWDKVCIESTGDQSEIYVRYYGSSNKDSYPVGITAGPTLVSSGGDPDEPDMRMYDCSGRFIGNKHLVTERLYLDNDDHNLYCQIVEDKCTDCSDSEKLNDKTYLVERNIEKFAAFAMPSCSKSSSSGSAGECAFVMADQVSDWSKVIAVKFVLVQAEESGQKVIKRSDREKFTLWGKSGEEIVYEAPADSKVRRMLSGSAFLRNE